MLEAKLVRSQPAFDANDPNELEVISLSKSPFEKVPITRVTHSNKHGHTFDVSRFSDDATYLGIKGDDGRDICSMNKGQTNFVPETVQKSFVGKNLDPWTGRKYPPERGADGFYYCYCPTVENHIWGRLYADQCKRHSSGNRKPCCQA